MSRVLLIEDDTNLGQHLMSAMRAQAFETTWISSIDGIVEQINKRSFYNLILLDRLIEHIDTKDWLARFKSTWPDCPIMVLSAINTPNERTQLIELGVDDYVGKPFTTQEVMARCKSLIRRGATTSTRYLKVGPLVLDLMSRQISVGEMAETLPTKEFMVLQVLAKETGRVWSRDALLETVWGNNLENETNVVEATITHLRRKLADIKSEVKIRNMRNAGYWLEA